jgi:hypothetical protein
MSEITRTYDLLEAAVEAHRAASTGATWLRLSDSQYDAIAGSALRTANHRGVVEALRAAREIIYHEFSGDPTEPWGFIDETFDAIEETVAAWARGQS